MIRFSTAQAIHETVRHNSRIRLKVLDHHNITALSKLIYRSGVMPSGNAKSFTKLSRKLILDQQNSPDFDKLTRILSSELISTYGLDVDGDTINEIAVLVDDWFHN